MTSKPRPARKPNAGGGRYSRLTDETQRRIVEAIRAGNYIETAAQYAGVNKTTIYAWLKKADDPDQDPRYAEFRNAVEEARAQAEARNVMLIQKAANEGTWQAAAWYLERTAPHRWGRQARIELTGDGGGPVQVEHSARDSLATKFAEIERRAVETIIDAEVIDDDEEDQPSLRLAQ